MQEGLDSYSLHLIVEVTGQTERENTGLGPAPGDCQSAYQVLRNNVRFCIQRTESWAPIASLSL